MSAYMVSWAHIDAMVAAGLEPSRVQGEQLSWNTLPDDQMAALHRSEWHTYRRRLGHDNAGDVGRMLWAENLASIQHRYPDTVENPAAIPGPIDFSPADIALYRYDSCAVSYGIAGGIDPVKMLKAVACYRYQSCEHPGWLTSEAYRFCEALEGWLIRKLPGYEDAPWSIDRLAQLSKTLPTPRR